MKAAPFRYHAPTTVAEVLGLLVEHGDEAKLLAGGQSLVPIMALRLGRYGHLIDLGGVDGLRGVGAVDGHVRVGSMTTQTAVERDPTIAERVPLVAAAVPHIGHFQIRNRGTVGGSIAHADPAAELPAVALALGATMEIAGPGGDREVAATDFFTSMWTTALADDEILTAVRFPARSDSQGFAVDEVARRHGDFALVGAVCAVDADADGGISDAAIALFGVGPTAVRATEAEAALVEAGPDADLDEIGRAASSGLDPNDDVHASGDYRRRAGAAIVARALRRAIDEARGGRP